MSAEIIFQGSPSCCGACGAWCQRTKWTITTQYIEKEYGFCCQTINTLQLIRVRDLNYAGGCCQSCGTITIYSSDETDPELRISGIPNSKDVYAKIRDAVNKATANARIELQQK